MPNAKMVQALIQKLTGSTDDAVPKVFPSPAPGEPVTNFGPTPSQLDRNPLVLEAFDAQRASGGKPGVQGTVEDQLDAIERELIDAGEIDVIPERARIDETPTRSSTDNTPEQQKQVEGFIDPASDPASTHFQELDNLEAFLAGKSQTPIVGSKKVGPTKAARGTGGPVDLVGEDFDRSVKMTEDLISEQRTPEEAANLANKAGDANVYAQGIKAKIDDLMGAYPEGMLPNELRILNAKFSNAASVVRQPRQATAAKAKAVKQLKAIDDYLVQPSEGGISLPDLIKQLGQ